MATFSSEKRRLELAFLACLMKKLLKEELLITLTGSYEGVSLPQLRGKTILSLYKEIHNGWVSPPPLSASGVKAALRHKQAQTHTHMQAQHGKQLTFKPSFVPKDLLMRAQRQPENVNPHNQSSTPAKIDIGNGVEIVSLLIIAWQQRAPRFP